MKKITTVAVLACASIALTACGGSSDDVAEETSTVTSSEETTSKPATKEKVDAMPWLESQMGATPGEVITQDPTIWYGYVSGAYVDGSNLHVQLQVDRKMDKDLGEQAAKALANFVMFSDDHVVDGVNWAIAEDGTGVVIEQESVPSR